MKRTPLKRHTRLRPKARHAKRGVVSDPAYREWILPMRCLACERKQVQQTSPTEGHHVDKPRNDRRMLPLCGEQHHRLSPVSVHGGGGRRRFEARFGIDFEVEIQRLNALYEAQCQHQS